MRALVLVQLVQPGLPRAVSPGADGPDEGNAVELGDLGVSHGGGLALEELTVPGVLAVDKVAKAGVGGVLEGDVAVAGVFDAVVH